VSLGADQPWKYIVPKPGQPHESGPLRALSLSDEKPPDVEEEADYRGARRRYAQLRYGSPNSTRVAVAVHELAPGEADVYVDADRDRKIEAAERLPAAGRRWRLPLSAEWIEDHVPTPDYDERTVILQLSRSGRTLSFATAGYLEGSLELAASQTTCRRMDGDGNGRFADPEDRIWVDLNGDAQWDRFAEQFLCAPILKLEGARYAVRTNRRGDQYSVEELTGTGTIQLRVNLKSDSSRVEDFHALLVGRDGSAVALRGVDAKMVVPTNEYRLASLTLVVADPGGGEPWSYVFSGGAGDPNRKWYDLQADAVITLEPLAGLKLAADVAGGESSCRAGDELRITPRLRTHDGLSIDTAWRGDRLHYQGESVGAEVRLVATDGSLVAASRSGFG